MESLRIVMVICMAILVHSQTFDVTEYGAVGDQNTDDSQAFIKAWKASCQTDNPTAVMVIPPDYTFLIKTARFVGPCKPETIHVQIQGNLVAASTVRENVMDPWISFDNVHGLVVKGNGKLDGRGLSWWKKCPTLTSKCRRPAQLGFFRCVNFKVSGITSLNSPRVHFSVKNCQKGNFSHIHVSAPETSPNTDGFDISHSSFIQVSDTRIETGDDCIALENGASHIDIIRVTCGPGHGISIGSLGLEGDSGATAEEIHVKDSILKGAKNGARIKTWQGGSGYARKITFKNITFVGTSNPIIIDQYYCPHGNCPSKISKNSGAVKISDVSYIGLHGTSMTENAISLKCSDTVGCTGLLLDHINITSAASVKKVLTSTCINAHGEVSNSDPPVDCLLP